METKIIDGRAIARRVRDEARDDLRRLGRRPGLAVILVGDDPASHLYVGLKEKACAEAGIRFEKHLFPGTADQNEVVRRIEALNEREDIDAILVQLPLPPHMDEDAVVGAMRPDKDADGFHPRAVLTPGLAAGILLLAREAEPDLTGKTLAVLSNSKVFSEPVEALFRSSGARVAVHAADADIVVVALGRPGAVRRETVKKGAVVIDVGTNRTEDGRVLGDADFYGLLGHASAVTPVPGGVGPVTVAMLLRNVVELAKRKLSVPLEQ